MTTMVVFDGAPLTLFQGEGFQDIFGEVAREMNLCTSAASVGQRIVDKHHQARSKLAEMLKGNLACAKFEVASGRGRHFLGVTLQFYHDRKMQV
jgi:hypothetical protein